MTAFIQFATKPSPEDTTLTGTSRINTDVERFRATIAESGFEWIN
jgi:hypothetical protein